MRGERFKPGDWVLVMYPNEILQEYCKNMDTDGTIGSFVPSMYEFCGKRFMVKKSIGSGVLLEGAGTWIFSDYTIAKIDQAENRDVSAQWEQLMGGSL